MNADDDRFARARDHLAALLPEGDHGHGLAHCERVAEHVRRALEEEAEGESKARLDARTRECVLLAALLHDADDPKLFPPQADGAASDADTNRNARKILEALPVPPADAELVLRMIDLVSCSKNGNHVPEDARERPWLLLPRYADRLEAIGRVGIVRCYAYNQHKARPLFLASTLRARTRQELAAIATPERFAQYQANGTSASFIDHFYDKLLHVNELGTDNPYLLRESSRRHADVEDFVLEFGRTGRVDEDAIKAMREE